MHYGFESTGLRYFNVFGRRQRENGDYAAVIPKWINNIINNKKIEIYGDGITSRDFCYIDNVIQANILATFNKTKKGNCEVYNIAVGHQTSLNSLFYLIKSSVEEKDPSIMVEKPIYKDFRAGDMRHSQANISKAKKLLGYTPNYKVKEGIKETVSWYMEEMQK
jgi:UDP-N-acetylglucosamine 4-epimerase